MRSRERAGWAGLALILAVALWLRAEPQTQASVSSRPRPQPGARLSMQRLHEQGGVPLGWQMSVPPGDERAGRQAFVDLGCPSCHAVAGEPFSRVDSAARGPELSGMGSHHPPAYFAEAILNPDAVLIDGPGYVGADGHSTMPVYPEMTAAQLADVVAYLASLRQLESQTCHAAAPPAGGLLLTRLPRRDRPGAGDVEEHRFFAQSFDVLPGRLDDFESWFARRGRPQLLAVAGLVRVDTFVDSSRAGPGMTMVLAFRDEAALRNFLGDPATADLWKELDGFIGPHGHVSSDAPLVYRAPTLSAD